MNEKILFLPIDIPFDNSLIKYIDAHKYEFTFSTWNVMKLTKQTENYAVSDFNDHVKDKWNDIIIYLNNYFPYVEYINVKFHQSKKNIATPAHIDLVHPEKNIEFKKHLQDNEPCGYRIFIKGDRSKFYIINSAEKKIHCSFPNDTNVFIIRHADGIHGSEPDNNRIVLFLSGLIDKDKHEEILKRSKEKYKDYIIYDEID